MSDLLAEVNVALPTEGPKVYVGRRLGGLGADVAVVYDGATRPLEPLWVDRANGFGFEWGYSGTGPTALARALLADHLGWQAPPTLVVEFRDEFVARFPKPMWSLLGSDIATWLGRRLGGSRD